MMSAAAVHERRHDLDWLRVLAILLLVYFHTGMIFAAEVGWHVKNSETSALVREVNYFLSRWRMALLFLISGVGTHYALRRRSAGGYVRERAKRLLVPVVFGMLVVVPPQIYLERVAGGAAFASYFEFWPSVLQLRLYPEGNLSYHHLWFVFYLFLYSLAALPLFLCLRSPRGQGWGPRLARRLRGWRIYTPALPLGGVLAALVVRFPGPPDVVHDWAHLLYYFLFFVFGYALAVADGLWRTVAEQRRASLTLALLALAVINYLRWNDLEPAFAYSAARARFELLQGFHAWCWVLAILGYARRYLNFRNAFLAYANEGIYPFYILHQTMIVLVGFYVVQVEESILMKYLFVSTLALLLSWAIYDLAVKPVPVLRFLFGMKPARRVEPAGTADAFDPERGEEPELRRGAAEPSRRSGRPAVSSGAE